MDWSWLWWGPLIVLGLACMTLQQIVWWAMFRAARREGAGFWHSVSDGAIWASGHGSEACHPKSSEVR